MRGGEGGGGRRGAQWCTEGLAALGSSSITHTHTHTDEEGLGTRVEVPACICLTVCVGRPRGDWIPAVHVIDAAGRGWDEEKVCLLGVKRPAEGEGKRKGKGEGGNRSQRVR